MVVDPPRLLAILISPSLLLLRRFRLLANARPSLAQIPPTPTHERNRLSRCRFEPELGLRLGPLDRWILLKPVLPDVRWAGTLQHAREPGPLRARRLAPGRRGYQALHRLPQLRAEIPLALRVQRDGVPARAGEVGARGRAGE